MIRTAGALLLLLVSEGAAEDDPAYPVKLRTPVLTEPGRPFMLTDLRYRVADEGHTRQALDARFRIGTWGFLGAEVDDQRRGVSLTTHRFDIHFFDDHTFTNVQAGLRLSRLSLRTRAERRAPADGKGWVLDAEAGVRLTRDLEAFASFLTDTDPSPPHPLATRSLRGESLSLLYQHGVRADLSLGFSRARLRTNAGFDLTSRRLSAAASTLVLGSEIETEGTWEEVLGRLPRHEGLAAVSLHVPAGRHLLVAADSRNRWEPGVKWFEHEVGAGLSWFGRDVRLSRAGQAANRTETLARRASAIGYNERRDHTEAGRRALRERVALSPRRDEFRDELESLYRAQVAERNVPLVGIEARDAADDVAGTKTRTIRAFLGMPWPVAWPWARSEACAPFLTASYTEIRQRFGLGFLALTREWSLTASLNREMSLALRTSKPGQVPLDVARGVGHLRRIELEYVYAFGR